MNFEENEIISAAMLGFDMIEGPVLKWTRTFVANEMKSTTCILNQIKEYPLASKTPIEVYMWLYQLQKQL